MSNKTGNSSNSRVEVRIGDAERDAAINRLQKHFELGHLTQEEFEDRSTLAFKAKLGSELKTLFRDMPKLQEAPPKDVPKRNSSGLDSRGIITAVSSIPYWVWLMIVWTIILLGQLTGHR